MCCATRFYTGTSSQRQGMNDRTHSATTSLCSTESERRARSTCVKSGRGMKTRYYIQEETQMFHLCWNQQVSFKDVSQHQ